MADDPLRILIVDDSALYCQLIKNVLREIPDVEVVGSAKSGQEALDQVDQLTPDLMTLDVCMPGRDGLAVLRELKKKRSRTKAIMLSSLTANGAQVTTDALMEGAFDFIHKPSGSDVAANRKSLADALREKIAIFRDSRKGRSAALRPASSARSALAPSESGILRGITPPAPSESGILRGITPTAPSESGILRGITPTAPSDSGIIRGITSPARTSSAPCQAVLIGTSTGGPVALREVLAQLPEDLPVPVLIVQHMPAQYTHSLAQRLNEVSPLEVVEACDGMTLEPGWAFLAPGGRHMKVVRRGLRTKIQITDDPPECSVRPSVDYLFRSAAEVFGGELLAVVMTGMGRDGTESCRELKRRGAYIIAQHADGCVVYGMPKAIVDEQLADRVVPLDQIAGAVLARLQPAATERRKS